MPGSLMESIDALSQSALYREAMTSEVVDHFVGMKRHEIGRFLSTVTDWEHQEYFESY
jgi:glutamine synthetase